MEINKNDEKKIIEIWLTHADENSPESNETVTQICRDYSKNKYTLLSFIRGIGTKLNL